MSKKKRGGLFTKAILVLALVSIVPVVIIGYHVLRVDSRVLQNEILARQRTVAFQIASVLRNTVSDKALLFSIFTDLHSDFGGHEFIEQHDIEYLRQRNPEITHISVLNRNGRQLFYSSDSRSRFSYAPELANILQTCVKEGKEYIGSVNRSNHTMYALMAFPIREHPASGEVTGVLIAEMDLEVLGETLQNVYPKDLSILVFAKDGTIISYNGAKGGLALRPEPELEKMVGQIAQQLKNEPMGEVKLADGENILVSSAPVAVTQWTVYVYQPSNVIAKLLRENTFHSFQDVLMILLAVVLFIVIVSYLVINPIVRPLKSLQRAAYRLSQDDYEAEADLPIPNNEIGDLAQVFLEMSDSLRARKEELAKINRNLETIVEERTKELHAATDELVKSERLAAIGQMASIISHEIRNPLAVISNSTRLIKTLVGPGDPKISRQLGIIDSEIKQASSIINEVLGYARSRDMILTTIDLNSYLREILASYPVSNVRIQEDFDPESVRIKVDAEEMKQALRNIISNACESIQGEGTVTVGTRTGKKVVCIFVQDTGPGISQELRNKIFSPFFTTKARGTGLGLAVVGKAIHRHKGKIFIESEEGKGTCFQVYLRIYKKPGDTKYGQAS